MDWGVFWAATTAAATVATAVSTTAVLWLRRRERPEPDWALEVFAHWPDVWFRGQPTPELEITCSLMNAGDGIAFRIELIPSRCKVGLSDGNHGSTPRVALVKPGESVKWWISVLPDDFAAAAVQMVWTSPPTRLKKQRSMTWKLDHLVELPPDTRRRD